jgi:RNA polymerase sigma-70 factor (ECF subfamily)
MSKLRFSQTSEKGQRPADTGEYLALSSASARCVDFEKEALQKDRLLVQRVLSGERRAAQELVRMYSPPLLKRLLRLLHNDRAQAEDCLQQVFLKALSRLVSYRGESRLHAWLNRIATHVVMDAFRAQQSRWRFHERLGLFSRAHGENGNLAIPSTLFEQDELRELLQKGLDALPVERRIAVMLCDWEGATVEEAAEQCELPIGTLASRLYRGRQELRRWLKREFSKSGLSVQDWFHE